MTVEEWIAGSVTEKGETVVPELVRTPGLES